MTTRSSITAQQVRRRELHQLPIRRLERAYMAKTGRIVQEVRRMFAGLDDAGRQIMVDAVIAAERR